MRKLTIKREKTFVGCAAKMQVYISDFQSNELEMPLHTVDPETGKDKVERISCRKLGELKSGEEATFEIASEAAMIFVIADKASKDFCNDCYPIKAGDEDISLSGKNKFNPAAGNAFRFNDNDVNMAANRKKSTGKGVLFIIAAAIIGILVGYFGMSTIMSSMNSKEKVFTAGPMSITLNESFEQQYPVGYSAVYSAKNAAVFVTVDNIDKNQNIVVNYTAAEYAQRLIDYNKFTGSTVITDKGLTYFTYDESNDGEDISHYFYIYKTDDAYWTIQFAIESKMAKRYSDDIAKWAGSVKFN